MAKWVDGSPITPISPMGFEEKIMEMGRNHGLLTWFESHWNP